MSQGSRTTIRAVSLVEAPETVGLRGWISLVFYEHRFYHASFSFLLSQFCMSTQLDENFLLGTTLSSQRENPTPSAFLNQDYVALRRAWVNEKRAPELLPYEFRTVENIVKIHRPQWTLINARQAQWAAGRDTHIRDLLIMEADRVEYMLKSYLRFRLFKIQKYARHYLSDIRRDSLMSPAEIQFASNIVSITETTFKSLFLRYLPQGDDYFQSLTASEDPGGDMVRRPRLDRAVFIRVNDHIGTIPTGTGDETATLEKGHDYMIRYDLIRNFVLDNRVNLI
jgi:GINS complex subunit 4